MPTVSHTRAETATYVYGVTWGDAPAIAADGVCDAAVRLLEHGELAALVSDLSSPNVRARRRDLLRHANVLQQAFEGQTVVPLRFGTVFSSDEDVVAELFGLRYEDLVALLQRLDGLGELTMRAFYDETGVLTAIVRDTPEVAGLRGAGGPAEQVRLGEAVAEALADRRNHDADEIVAELSSLAHDTVVEERVAEFEVVRAAFLVDRSRVARLEAQAEELAQRFGGVVRFKLTGPVPPHHFVSEQWAS